MYFLIIIYGIWDFGIIYVLVQKWWQKKVPVVLDFFLIQSK